MRVQPDTVVDASFLVPIIAGRLGPSERAVVAQEVLQRAGVLVAPCLLMFELLNAIRGGVRARVLSDADAVGSIVDACELGVHLEPSPDVSVALRIAELAQAHGLTAYDASYLELAMRTKSPLATFDSALIRAAQAEGVQIVSLGVN
jgi:predicted nucleic acid-binding protein